jgi:hypothetical protein
MALRLNQEILPNIVLYIFTGPVARTLEHHVTMLTSNIMMSQMIPLGVEATMYAFANTIINLN